jgi:alginate O-acetyltransferase complex protein AlgJ
LGTLTRRVSAFLLGAAVVMTVPPIINAMQGAGVRSTLSTLYDTAFAWSAVGGPLREMGISTRPQQVVVGKSGWLFLGDQYAQAVSAKRRSGNADDLSAATRSAAAWKAWSRWLADNGVQDWRILVCPDKDGVYPELLPGWYSLASDAPIDLALSLSDPRHVVDARAMMHRARARETVPLYLRTDSHWTERGAFVAYRALAQSYAVDDTHIDWLDDDQVQFVANRVPSGDLARLLQVSDVGGDASALAIISEAMTRGRTLADAFSGRRLEASALAGVEPPTHPVLTRSPGALNQRRLLWLRDSFGAALRPFIIATDSEVIELDRGAVTPRQLQELVRQWKPDSVLVSVVERNARSPWFEALPPEASGRGHQGGALPH